LGAWGNTKDDFQGSKKMSPASFWSPVVFSNPARKKNGNILFLLALLQQWRLASNYFGTSLSCFPCGFSCARGGGAALNTGRHKKKYMWQVKEGRSGSAVTSHDHEEEEN
jgi:hypothetical protein